MSTCSPKVNGYLKTPVTNHSQYSKKLSEVPLLNSEKHSKQVQRFQSSIYFSCGFLLASGQRGGAVPFLSNIMHPFPSPFLSASEYLFVFCWYLWQGYFRWRPAPLRPLGDTSPPPSRPRPRRAAFHSRARLHSICGVAFKYSSAVWRHGGNYGVGVVRERAGWVRAAEKWAGRGLRQPAPH